MGAAHRATQDPLIARFNPVFANQSEEDLRLFIASREPARKAGEALALAVADPETHEFLGTISLLRLEWPQRLAVALSPPRSP